MASKTSAPETANLLHAPRPVILCILDGWGWRPDSANNAIALARTPHYSRLIKTCPLGLLQTSGLAVGLPEGQMGNSEVGHMNLGGGRVVMQDLPRIDTAVANGSLDQNPGLLDLIAKLRKTGGTCHLMGLMSPGGVHSHQKHMAALARILCHAGIPVAVHAFLDGRDTPPQSALEFLAEFKRDTAGLEALSIATVSGRYYAMDRDKRWDRVQKAYDCLTKAAGNKAASAEEAVKASYGTGVNDEFVLPTAIGNYSAMKDGDGLLMANFRTDRAREILTALADPAFDGFSRALKIKFAAAYGMVEYSAALAPLLGALFPPENMIDTLGEVVAARGLKQLRIAETEKYAHVTFFFNGGAEAVFKGEDRILVPSPKVATYDLKPEMSAGEVTGRLVAAIGSGTYDLIVVNYANPDMVGHTGILPAAIKAVETIDACLGRVEAAVVKAGGVMLITADHGNIELMEDPESGVPYTAHTTFDVPLILVNEAVLGQKFSLKNGRLADVAPTLLALMRIPQPAAMTGHVLLERVADEKNRAAPGSTRASA
jgi:2,3-bisphosphoglycerate-independent phosphoglycerate mutase